MFNTREQAWAKPYSRTLCSVLLRLLTFDGIRSLLLHAKDETARQLHLNWEFEPSSSAPLPLFLLVKDLKAMLSGRDQAQAYLSVVFA